MAKVDVQALAELFKEADAAALAADPGEGNDGGTCNCDTPAFRIKGVRMEQVQEASRLAGVPVQPFDWFGGRRWFWLVCVLMGQGNRRTRMMEAAQRVLRDAQESGRVAGLEACGYHQAD